MADTGTAPVIPADLQQYNSYVVDPKWQIKFTIIWTSVLACFAVTALPAILRGRRKWVNQAFGVTEDWRDKYARVPDENQCCGGVRTPTSPPPRKNRILVARILSTLGSVFYWTPDAVGLNVGHSYIATVLACICTSAPLMTNPNRAGFLAIAQLTPIFLLASKNTVFSLLLPPSYAYTRINVLHRWVSRTMFLSAAVHGSLWINNHLVWNIPILGQQKETSGVAAFGVLCVIVLTSLRPVRVFAWGVFDWVQCVFIVGTKKGVLIGAFYAFDLLMRAGRFRLKDARLIPVDDQMTIIHIPDCDAGFQAGQHLRVRVFFGGRMFESHPLSIISAPSLTSKSTTCLTAADMEAYYNPDNNASFDESTADVGAGIVLGARAIGDWTKALNKYARDSIREAALIRNEVEDGDEENRTGTASSGSSALALGKTVPPPTSVPVQVMFDGPYGGCTIDLEMYERVLLVAGGSGATFAIGCMDALVALCAAPPPNASPRTKRIDFVWCTRSFGSVSWFAPILRAIARTAAVASVRLTMTVYVTCMCSPEDVSVPGLTVRVGGRPDLGCLVRGVPVGHIGTTMEGSEGEMCGCGCVDEALKAQTDEQDEGGSIEGDEDEEKGSRKGRGEREDAVGVCASGPDSLTREAANAVSKYAAGGREVGFHAEGFSV
ncbi:hypothetical protein C0991_012346 [Blastosporella zonata]|nr:hypothetical protein C0991_012346 [Blastosporella zonata]